MVPDAAETKEQRPPTHIPIRTLIPIHTRILITTAHIIRARPLDLALVSGAGTAVGLGAGAAFGVEPNDNIYFGSERTLAF